MRHSSRWLASLAVLLTTVCAAGAEEDGFDKVRAYIEKQMTDGDPASVTVVVSRGGETIWSESWGWADRERRVLADEHTMYSLASISKPITATGLMRLVERGKIDLDLPVNRYLGRQKLTGYAGDAAEATVRRVAGHMAGLPLHYHFFYEDEPFIRPTMEETIRRYGILVTPPGERFEYSNLGYGILDYCIERTSGKRFADFMRSEVFLPLGMTRTSIGIDPGLEPYAAVRYRPDGLRIPFYDFDHRGASAAFASAHDLVRFGNFHIGLLPDGAKPILNDASRAAMKEISELSNYGIGWSVASHPAGVDVVSHKGGMAGVSTKLDLIPDRGIVVAVLSNSQGSVSFRVASMLIDALLGEKRKVKLSSASSDGESKSAFLGSHWSGEVVTHNGSIPLTLWFKEDGDVHAKLGKELETLVTGASFNGSRFRGRMAGDIGTPDANRMPYHLHIDLTLRGDILNGSLVAISLPGTRVGNALPSWVELKREANDDATNTASASD